MLHSGVNFRGASRKHHLFVCFCPGSCNQLSFCSCVRLCHFVQNQVPCPDGSINPLSLQTSEAACGPCPSGFLCLPGDIVPTPCPPGGYCPEFQGFVRCPNGTYSAAERQNTSDTCTNCPAGYYCPLTGMAKLRTIYFFLFVRLVMMFFVFFLIGFVDEEWSLSRCL